MFIFPEYTVLNIKRGASRAGGDAGRQKNLSTEKVCSDIIGIRLKSGHMFDAQVRPAVCRGYKSERFFKSFTLPDLYARQGAQMGARNE